MIKIVKKGTKPKPRKMIRGFTCLHCNCIFTADKDDYSTSFHPLSGFEYYCKCPCCGYVTFESVSEDKTDGWMD